MLRVTAKFSLVTAVIIARRVAPSIAVPVQHGSTSIEPVLERIPEMDALVSAAVSPRAGAALASTACALGGSGT